MLRAAFRIAFFPVMIALSIVSWAFHDEGTAALKAARWPIDFATVVLLASLVLLWFAEQFSPLNPEWNYRLLASPIARATEGWHRLARDLAYFFIVTTAGSLLITWVATHLETRVRALGLPVWWPTGWPFIAKTALAFLLFELSSYWFHRLAHQTPFFWRFHQTHHVVSELTSMKALRTHPIDNLFFYVARHVPLLMLGAGSGEIVAVVYFGATLSLISHANVQVIEGPFGLVINFPRYHAVHHSAEPVESQSNFGCHTVLFDRVFGTFRIAPTLPAELGLHPRGRRSLWQELVNPPRSET